MVLFHILDDFVLQPACLSNLKQRDWWKKACTDEYGAIDKEKYDKYKHDYIVALVMHSLSWSAMILVPSIILGIDVPDLVLIALFFGNALVHTVVDDLKANEKTINLVIDQCIHIAQIFCTWCVIISIA